MNLLKARLLELGVDEERYKLFFEYKEQLLLWNEKVNLTRIVDNEEFEKRHFIESLEAANHNSFAKAENIIDIGTGAGFPGIPLAIAFPKKHFALVDSLAKRLKIVTEIAENIGINNIETIHSRAEDLGNDSLYREKYDICLSRAVADLSVLSELCLPFVKIGGYFGAYKNNAEEIVKAKKSLSKMGGGLPEEIPPIYWFRKERKTPKGYPRKAGIPSKSPIL